MSAYIIWRETLDRQNCALRPKRSLVRMLHSDDVAQTVPFQTAFCSVWPRKTGETQTPDAHIRNQTPPLYFDPLRSILHDQHTLSVYINVNEGMKQHCALSAEGAPSNPPERWISSSRMLSFRRVARLFPIGMIVITLQRACYHTAPTSVSGRGVKGAQWRPARRAMRQCTTWQATRQDAHPSSQSRMIMTADYSRLEQ